MSVRNKKPRNRNMKDIQQGMFMAFKIINSIDLELFIDIIEKGLISEHLTDEQLMKVLIGGSKKWVKVAEVAIKFRDETKEVLTR